MSETERRRVLVVDDERGMRYVARRVLERSFDVDDAASGEEALRLLAQTRYHLALIDVRLPGLSGLELVSRVKDISPKTDVIVMTGSAADPDEALEDAVRRDAFFFLRKPFPMSVLETLAERARERQELTEALDAYVRSLEQTLEDARVFQQRLLPPFRWQGPRVRVAANYVASKQLSGDFFDYWSLPHGGTAIFMADVMGHGPSAAMLTGIVKSQVRSLANEITEPGSVLHALEEELSRIRLNRFLTAFLLFDRPSEGEILVAGAGHPALLSLRPGEPMFEIASDGLPINTGLPIAPRESASLARRADTRLLLFTDGYAEAVNKAGRQFDESEPGTRSAFRSAAERALSSDDPEDGLRSLESDWSAWCEGSGGGPDEDDRAAVCVWLH